MIWEWIGQRFLIPGTRDRERSKEYGVSWDTLVGHDGLKYGLDQLLNAAMHIRVVSNRPGNSGVASLVGCHALLY